MKFSVIIPTYKRQEDLGRCLNSIMGQAVLPSEVIIIDDENLPEDFLAERKAEASLLNVDLVYRRKDQAAEKRGSSASRNIGLGLAKNEIVFVLDDDLVLDRDFFSAAMKVWEENKDEKMIGVGGVITNNRVRGGLEKKYNRFFGLSGECDWDVNRAGFQSWNDQLEKTAKGFYIHGGVCSYRRALVLALGGWRVFGGGREALEDVEFCWKAKRKGYYFLITPEAKVVHNHSLSGREDEFSAGAKESRNRLLIFSAFGKRSLASLGRFYWANFGWVARQVLAGKFKKAAGLVKGLF